MLRERTLLCHILCKTTILFIMIWVCWVCTCSLWIRGKHVCESCHDLNVAFELRATCSSNYESGIIWSLFRSPAYVLMTLWPYPPQQRITLLPLSSSIPCAQIRQWRCSIFWHWCSCWFGLALVFWDSSCCWIIKRTIARFFIFRPFRPTPNTTTCELDSARVCRASAVADWKKRISLLSWALFLAVPSPVPPSPPLHFPRDIVCSGAEGSRWRRMPPLPPN